VPELPEVQTTVDGINRLVAGRKILSVWTNYNSPFYKNQIKNPTYFKEFEKEVVGKKILGARRAGKNVLIDLSGGSNTDKSARARKTILVHMKMTGHLIFGKYKLNSKRENRNPKLTEKWKKEVWVPAEDKDFLWDPFNRHIRLVFALSGGKHLVFSDARKFGKVQLLDTAEPDDKHLNKLGPDALSVSHKEFIERVMKKPGGKIKQVLMNQEVLAGVGNIYSDELLWEASIHPESKVGKIPKEKLHEAYKTMKVVLKKGIKFKGDSTSDYRNIDGGRGEFQNRHNVYGRKGKPCPKSDGGEIKTTKVGGRTASYCPVHQELFK
jgi:formamidopyrimidine-DNA glycosylase